MAPFLSPLTLMMGGVVYAQTFFSGGYPPPLGLKKTHQIGYKDDDIKYYINPIFFFRIFNSIIPKNWTKARESLKVFERGAIETNSCEVYQCSEDRPTVVERL